MERLGAGPALQLHLTIADFVVDAHDTHHPVAVEQVLRGPAARKRRSAPRRFLEDRVPKFFGYFESCIHDNELAGTVLGQGFSYVDLSLFQIVEGTAYAFPKAFKAHAKKHSAVDGASRSRETASADCRLSGSSSPAAVQRDDAIFRHYAESWMSPDSLKKITAGSPSSWFGPFLPIGVRFERRTRGSVGKKRGDQVETTGDLECGREFLVCAQ